MGRYPKTAKLYESLLSDARLKAHWSMANYMAVIKLGYNDHGPIHARVVAAAAMQMMQLLHQNNVPFDVVDSGAGDLDDAHAVVLAGILLHDIGNEVHRVNHEAFGTMLAQPILERHFSPLYPDPEKMQTLISFTLSTIACHDCEPPPLTMEGAVVAVADATDMTKGRGRIAFDLGKVDIHSVSALAVEAVSIHAGRDQHPIEIVVSLSNSAGIFQVEQILARKLVVTPLKDYVAVRAVAADDYPELEERIIHSVVFEGGRFRVDDTDNDKVTP